MTSEGIAQRPRSTTRRVVLTRKQMETVEGAILLETIRAIADDREIALDDAIHLRAAAAQLDPEQAAAGFLIEVLDEVLEDGRLDEREALMVWGALTRILPVDLREELLGLDRLDCAG